MMHHKMLHFEVASCDLAGIPSQTALQITSRRSDPVILATAEDAEDTSDAAVVLSVYWCCVVKPN